jgi:hypothetical protein
MPVGALDSVDCVLEGCRRSPLAIVDLFCAIDRDVDPIELEIGSSQFSIMADVGPVIDNANSAIGTLGAQILQPSKM